MLEKPGQYCTGLNTGEGSHVVVSKAHTPLLNINDIVDGELKHAMEEVEKWKHIALCLEKLDILKAAGGSGKKEVAAAADDDDVIVNGSKSAE
eukprot:14610276-Ditylum_brightwellii.AAC.1